MCGVRCCMIRFLVVSAIYSPVRATARHSGVLRLASSIGVCQGAQNNPKGLSYPGFSVARKRATLLTTTCADLTL